MPHLRTIALREGADELDEGWPFDVPAIAALGDRREWWQDGDLDAPKPDTVPSSVASVGTRATHRLFAGASFVAREDVPAVYRAASSDNLVHCGIVRLLCDDAVSAVQC